MNIFYFVKKNIQHNAFYIHVKTTFDDHYTRK